jgi:hypothetical protein
MFPLNYGRLEIPNRNYSCALDHEETPFLSFIGHEFIPMRTFGKYAGSILTEPEAIKRLEILLNNTMDYDLSQFQIHGYAFINMFAFGTPVHAAVKPLLEKFLKRPARADGGPDGQVAGTTTAALQPADRTSSSPSISCEAMDHMIVIGMHLRHPSPGTPSVSLDAQFGKALDHIMEENPGKSCIILLASDREVSIDRMEFFARGMRGCEVIVAARYANGSIADSSLDRPDCDQLCREQGVWAKGVPQLADILLLAHSQYFILTEESTYSMIIANLVIWASVERKWSYNPLYVADKSGYHRYAFPAVYKHSYVCPSRKH